MNIQSQKIKVAYAESQAVVREAIVALLEKSNKIEVAFKCSNGKDLLEQLILADVMPDLCLIDLNMPLMNGFTLLKEIRKRWPELPCLILTSFEEERYLTNIVKSGASGYLLKTCTGKELIKAVKMVYKKGHYYNEIFNEQIIQNIIAENKKEFYLKAREILFLKSICSDLSYAEIAKEWNTTYKTVDGVRDRLFAKLRVTSRVGLVLFAVRLGYYRIETENFSS